MLKLAIGHLEQKICRMSSSLLSVIVLPSVLEILSSGTYADESLLREDTCGQTASVDAASIKPNCVLVLLQPPICVVPKEDSLRSIPEPGPRPIVEKLGGNRAVREDASHVHHESRILFCQADARDEAGMNKQGTQILAGNVPRKTI